jgi:acetyl esterase
VNHGFFFWPGVVDKASAAIDEACVWVRSVANAWTINM